MKFPSKVLFVVLIAALFAFPGCKHHNPPPEPITDQQLDKLSIGPWKVSSVTRDGVDEKANYTNFTLTMSGTKGNQQFGYTTQNRPSLSAWSASGNFTFDGTNPTTTLKRDDGITFTYSVSGNSLQMSFTYNGPGISGRTGVVNGQWAFQFTQ